MVKRKHVMRRFRPAACMKMILAASVLAGSVGSTPTFGHAHEKTEADHHDHLDWAAHGHSHAHLDAVSGTEQHASVESNDAVFHLHGMWFGIPFSLPAPTEPEDARATQNPLATACLAPVVTMVATHLGSVRGRPICPDAFGLAPDPRAGLELPRILLPGSWSLSRAGGHCALEARSAVLRC